MTYTIDRFEGDFAVLETEQGEFITLARKVLPQEAKEGDMLQRLAAGDYQIDQRATQQRAQRIAKKMAKLFED